MEGPPERSITVPCDQCSGTTRALVPSESRRTDEDPDRVVELDCPHCGESFAVNLRME